MKNKLNAYTLTEVLITIVLTSIIIVISYSLFNLVNKQLLQYQRINQFDMEYGLFHSVLTKDTYNAVNYKLNESSFTLFNNDNSFRTYKIENKKILRINEVTIDTFNLEVSNYNFSEKNIKFSKQAEIRINLVNSKEEIHSNYFIKKSSTELINTHYLNEDKPQEY